MSRYLLGLILGMSILLNACADNSKASFNVYYEKVKACEHSQSEDCVKIIQEWQKILPLIASLEENPQILGVEVIELQDKLVKVKSAQEQAKIKVRLQDYYQVIRWFESPVS